MQTELNPLSSASALDADARILYIENDALLRSAFVSSLVRRGIDVDVAGSRSEALTFIGKHAYPVIVTDLFLADADGVSLAEELHSVQPDASFIITTGLDVEMRGSGGLEESISCFLKKPWNEQQLAAAVDTARESYRVRRSSQAPRDSHAYSVLLVEDNAADAYYTALQLERVGSCSEVLQCSRLEQALALLRGRRFDAVLADLGLPDATGLQTVEKLRAAAPDAALIVLSGFDDDAKHAQAVRLGAHDYLVKGRSEAELVGRSLQQAVDRTRRERRVSFMSQHDSLTQLINRDGFCDKLAAAVTHSRKTGRHCAVMQLDIDSVRSINENYGQDAGDAVLSEIARRIQASVREEDTVARLGGDEFGILLEELDDAHACQYVARRLLQITSLPVLLRDDLDTRVSVSLGIAVSPDANLLPDALLQAAENAVGVAKAAGGGFHVYEADDPDVKASARKVM